VDVDVDADGEADEDDFVRYTSFPFLFLTKTLWLVVPKREV
jgi:hypothetical protein